MNTRDDYSHLHNPGREGGKDALGLGSGPYLGTKRHPLSLKHSDP